MVAIDSHVGGEDAHALVGRLAHRLELEGFTQVYDLIGGRATWTALGLPTEGVVGDRRRIGTFASVVDTVEPNATMGDVRALLPRFPVAVVDEGILIGSGGETAELVERLMGKRPEARFRFIQDNARFVEDLDV